MITEKYTATTTKKKSTLLTDNDIIEIIKGVNNEYNNIKKGLNEKDAQQPLKKTKDDDSNNINEKVTNKEKTTFHHTDIRIYNPGIESVLNILIMLNIVLNY